MRLDQRAFLDQLTRCEAAILDGTKDGCDDDIRLPCQIVTCRRLGKCCI